MFFLTKQILTNIWLLKFKVFIFAMLLKHKEKMFTNQFHHHHHLNQAQARQ